MRASEFIVERFLVELTDAARSRAIARFEAELEAKPDIELTDRERTQIQRCVELWSTHGSGDIFRLSFDQAYQIVDNNLLKQELKGRATEKLDPDAEPEAEPDYKNLAPEDSDLIIYLGNTKKKCIAYGDGYSFCISRKDASNAYGDYRYNLFKTFYFVRNPDKPESDNTHLIVVSINNDGNFSYTLSDNLGDVEVDSWDDIVALEPKLADLEHLFVYAEPSAEEIRRYHLARSYLSPEEYQALSPRDKFIRIDLGGSLSAVQQDLTKVDGDPVLSQLLIGAYVKRNPRHFTNRSWNRLGKRDQRYVRDLVKRRFQENQQDYFNSMLVVGLLDELSKEELLKIVISDGLVTMQIIDTKPELLAELLADEYTQVAVVTETPSAIVHIFDLGIRPSDRAQIAAVSKEPTLIQQILDAGIRPSEQVQIAAVKSNASLIIDILDANFTDPIIPSEAVQIAAVMTDPRLLEIIRRRGITPSPNVVAAAEKAQNSFNDNDHNDYYKED